MKMKQIMMLTLLLLGVTLAREAQAFYNPSTGRWLSRDPAQEGGGLNLHGMVNNDPVNFFDMIGLWDTDQHHALIDRWLQLNPAPNNMDWAHYKWHCLEIDVPALLKKGSDNVDGVGHGGRGFCDAQSSANSYQHSMRAWYESKDSARSKRNIFILGLEVLAMSDASVARQDIYAGDGSSAEFCIDNAVVHIGEAQHPLADETSPPHAGFQVWFGPLDGIAILGLDGYLAFVELHHRRESPAVYAGMGDGPANTVARQMHKRLLNILRQ
jgi:hypothetical protein